MLNFEQLILGVAYMLDYTRELFIEDQKRALARLREQLASGQITDTRGIRLIKNQIKLREQLIARELLVDN